MTGFFLIALLTVYYVRKKMRSLFTTCPWTNPRLARGMSVCGCGCGEGEKESFVLGGGGCGMREGWVGGKSVRK